MGTSKNNNDRELLKLEEITFEEMFDVEELQKLQEQFSQTTGIASVITHLDGTPITVSTKVCRLCSLVRTSEKGLANCYHSDATLGRLAERGKAIHPCLSADLWDAASVIKINGKPIAFWLVGQVRNESLTKEDIRRYAREIGIDENEAADALTEVPVMDKERLSAIVDFIDILADQLSTIAYQNYLQKCHLEEDEKLIEAQKKNEAYLNTLINTIPDLLWMKNTKGEFLYCNRRFEKLFDLKVEDILGKTDYDFIEQERADQFHRNDQLAIDTRTPVRFEEDVEFLSDGHWETLETVKTPIIQDDGRIMGTLGIGRDITAYKKNEKERLENIDFFKNLDRINRVLYEDTEIETVLENALDMIMEIFHCQRAFFSYPCDPSASEFTVNFDRTAPGYTSPFKQGERQPITPYLSRMYGALLEDGGVQVRYTVPEEGTELWRGLQIRSVIRMALYPKTGKPWFFAIHNCVDDRDWSDKEIELFAEIGRRVTFSLSSLLLYRKVRDNEKFLSNIIENIPNMIFIKDAENLKFIRFNRAGEELTGMKRENMLGKSDYDFYPREQADFFAAQDRKALGQKKMIDIPQEKINTLVKGERVLHTQKIPIMNSSNEPEYLLGISEDITERLNADKELLETKEWLQAFMESTADAITIFDNEDRFVLINTRAKEFYPEKIRARLLGLSLYELTHLFTEEMMNAYERVKATGKAISFTMNIHTENRLTYLHNKLFPIGNGIGVISSDITEQKKLEEQILQVQKIESIGRLAGGVAHDNNNILGVIMGYTEMAQNHDRKDDQMDSFLKEIMDAAERSASLTRQLLAFARKQNVKPRILNLNETIGNMLKMLKSLIGESIELVISRGDNLWLINIDPVQVDQILANLCVNARDAIGETGRIIIETCNQVLDETYCKFHPGVEPGEYVCLSVTDNGQGMDGETLANIFDPFFTTKDVGEGTGLGLSTVYGIISQNGGSINVYSEPGIGTTFKIFFRRDEQDAQSETSDKEQEEIVRGGHERILIIEDEKPLLDMTALMLGNYGYRILTANSVSEALEISDNEGGRIDLILSDIVMPEMNGKKLTDKIIRKHPRIKCLFMSGYTDEIIARHGFLEDSLQFIQKPFSSRELALFIRKLLDGA